MDFSQIMRNFISAPFQLLSPFQKFVKIEGFSGILLITMTLLALIWANSPWSEGYRSIWIHEIGFSYDYFELKKPLLLWINDGLMAIFFFLIGLEIKREVLIGELNSFKKIIFPIAGAVGGVLLPVILFLWLNKDPLAERGWAIPMATDIAFSLAVLNILGKRVPLSLKLFLTAFAIVDDIFAVVVIALFYSGVINLSYLLVAFVILVFLFLLTYLRYYSPYILLFGGLIVWFFFLKSGLHPTLAGVLLAFTVPIRQQVNTHEFISKLEKILENIRKAQVCEKPLLSFEQIKNIDNLQSWIDRFQSPLQNLENKLHKFVAYFVIPVFAFANAGVQINLDHIRFDLVLVIMIALIAGKSLGISLVVFLARKINLIEYPGRILFGHIIGVSFLAGIGFTMSIFIASLAFENMPVYLDSAKTGIILGSFISAITGYLILRFVSRSA